MDSALSVALDAAEAAARTSEVDVKVIETEDGITAHIDGIRAVAELTKFRSLRGVTLMSGFNSDDFDKMCTPGWSPPKENWLFFNRLINQSGVPYTGTHLLDAVLKYCQEKGYSILNQVNAYGTMKQRPLEKWYIRKGFVPVNYRKYKDTVLIWQPKEVANV